MGACISWCCPRNAEGGANQDAHEGGAYGDANGGGAYNENSPLLRGMEGEDLGHASYSEQSMLAANGDLLHSYGFQNPQAKVIQYLLCQCHFK